MKVLGIADSDSYIKWGASILSELPDDWEKSLTIIRTPALPSGKQLAAALADTHFTADDSPFVDLADLAALIASVRPDVVLLSVRGPVVRVLIRMIVAAVRDRPLIVSGLPGISFPATLLALYYRSQVDVLILHSEREIAEFETLAAQWGIQQRFALATLPYLSTRRTPERTGTDIIFAAQAKVPRQLFEREQLLESLARAARAMPERRVVIKLRGTAGEAQTHSERYPYDVLLESLENRPENLVISTGPMSRHLDRAAGLVTVSSTAVIEAVARGVPSLVIDDFGVSPALINVVFEGSGLLGSSERLMTDDLPTPDPGWLAANYLQDASANTVISSIEEGVARRNRGPLSLRPQFRATIGGNIRRIWDRKRALGQYDTSIGGYLALGVGLPLRGTVRFARRMRSHLKAVVAPVEEKTPSVVKGA